MIKLSDIHENELNPRLIKDKKFKKLVKSIQTFPKMMQYRPIIVDKDNIVIGGNMRYRAIESIGKTEIPDNWVMNASDFTKAERERFVIVDNAGFGEWDYDMLANDWDTAELCDWGLDLDMPEEEEFDDIPEDGEPEKPTETTCPNCGFCFVKGS